MNEITADVAVATDPAVEVKHFVLTTDAEGNTIQVEVIPTGELVQEVEDAPAVH